MHEAGIARFVAAVLRHEDLAGRHVVLHVRGGHHGPDEFESALRLHLQVEAPELDPGSFQVVHDPVARLCVGCGREFSGPARTTDALAVAARASPCWTREQVDIGLVG